MCSRTNVPSRRAGQRAPPAAPWVDPIVPGFDAPTELREAGAPPPVGDSLRAGGSGERLSVAPTPHTASLAAAAALLRRTGQLSPPPVRPFFSICALEGWRRVPAPQLAAWSGIPWNRLRRLLAAGSQTPAGVAAWNLALHAIWLLDVAALPAAAVVCCMRLGRPAGLEAVLGARGVRFAGKRVEPGAFAATLGRYVAVLRAGFPP
jgi:hypothetical protein